MVAPCLGCSTGALNGHIAELHARGAMEELEGLSREVYNAAAARFSPLSRPSILLTLTTYSCSYARPPAPHRPIEAKENKSNRVRPNGIKLFEVSEAEELLKIVQHFRHVKKAGHVAAPSIKSLKSYKIVNS